MTSATPAAAQDKTGEAWPQLDLTLYAGGEISLEADPIADPFGYAIGLSAIARVSDVFGLGLQLEHDEFGWKAFGSSTGAVIPGSGFPDLDATVSHNLILLATRLYFLEAGAADVFAQLGLGYGGVTYAPEHPDCSISDGFAAQLGLGVEWRVARAIGIHTSVAMWPFGWGLGCDDIYYEGQPPDPPYIGMALGARAGVTAVWR